MIFKLHTPLKVTDRSIRQRISKDTTELNSTVNQLDLIDIYRLCHPTTAGYKFSNLHGTHQDGPHSGP